MMRTMRAGASAAILMLSTLVVLGPGPAVPVHADQKGATSAQRVRVTASSYMVQVTGEVTSVDPQSGQLSVRTGDGELTATFPPAAVQNVKRGDRVTVTVGLVGSNAPSASPGGSSTR